ncbi:cytochrome c oxidase subunit 3 [Tautonia sp. JC769]|uniref:cytochrome c oxidase subunit 3 n=1 Tax=Tautonia sp. JC769 TaxID=3232135 RepID=UPI003457BBAD
MSSASATAHDNTYGQDDTYLYHHFEDLQQQHESSSLGMWAFLSTEVLFFGGVLGAFAVVQTLYEPAMKAASEHLDPILGAYNTAVLLVSSLAMALAVRAAQLRQQRNTVLFLVATIVLGSAFLGVKAYEWIHDYHEALIPGINFDLERYPGRQILFWSFYFTLTGIHALHMIIGIVIIAIMAVLVQRRWFTGGGATQIEMLGLYWHFVDIVWVFLYPILYLINQ